MPTKQLPFPEAECFEWGVQTRGNPCASLHLICKSLQTISLGTGLRDSLPRLTCLPSPAHSPPPILASWAVVRNHYFSSWAGTDSKASQGASLRAAEGWLELVSRERGQSSLVPLSLEIKWVGSAGVLNWC